MIVGWKKVAQASVVYIDLGITPGMEQGIKEAESAGVTVEFRKIFEGK